MKIALVFPPYYLEPMYNLPPLGLINLATVLAKEGHETRIHDFVLNIRLGTTSMGPSIYDDCARDIASWAPDLVAFSTQCATYPAALQIARGLKEKAPHTPIVFGGHNASFVDETTLRQYPWVDAVIRGEGERSFPELIDAYQHGLAPRSVDGVTWRDGDYIIRNQDRDLIGDLNELPFPDYSLAPSFKEYRDACGLPRSIAILEVGRGCPHRCIYCSESVMWRRRTRIFSVDRIVEEMRRLANVYGAECFLLAYDQFTARTEFVREFCEKVINAELNNLPWYCISRLDTVNAELLGLMREAGCESMCYGIDSGSKRTLAFIDKNIDHGLLYQRTRETTESGIVPTLSYVIGFPEEEREDIDQTLELALKTGILGNINTIIQMPTVLAGSRLHEQYRNSLIRGVDTYFSLGLEFHDGHRLDEDDQLIDRDPEVFSSFYNVPCKGMSLQELSLLADHFPLIVNLYPMSFLLLLKETSLSPSLLFGEFLSFIQETNGLDKKRLDPQHCYKQFEPFASRLLRQRSPGAFPHLNDIMAYETAAIDAGKTEPADRNFRIDLQRTGEIKPQIKSSLIIRQFDFAMPQIIEDLKNGVIHGEYPPEQTILVFLESDHTLEVTEINEFGRDFLNLCDGLRTAPDIARELYPVYGSGLDYEKFHKECLEAAETLDQMGLFRRNEP